jgi:hypothetical protein
MLEDRTVRSALVDWLLSSGDSDLELLPLFLHINHEAAFEAALEHHIETIRNELTSLTLRR